VAEVVEEEMTLQVTQQVQVVQVVQVVEEMGLFLVDRRVQV
jgi:hypothetical protein